MSYILDALKRADAERERGTVPGLRAQPVPLVRPGPQDGASNAKLWLGLGAGLVLLLLAVLAWRMTARETPMEKSQEKSQAVAAAVAPAKPAVPTAPVAPVAPRSVPAPAPATPAPAPDAAVVPAPAVQQAPPSPARAPLPATKEPAALIAKPEPPTASKAPASAPNSAPKTESRIPSINELPDDIKRQLPPLAISGSIYSSNPAQRMLTIGSQMFQEGDKPAPDLVLEQIQPKSAVFNYKGTRYSVAY